MASKRAQYSASSASDTDSDIDVVDYEYNKFNSMKRKQREPKSFSKNALMARENRRRKKVYMENLERELNKERTKNKKYVHILKEQAEILEKQTREIKYMRGVLANNSDICKLLRSIHQNTGMPIGTSLNKDFTIFGNVKQEIASNTLNADVCIKDELDVHPWAEDLQLSGTLSEGLSAWPTTWDSLFDEIPLPALDLPLNDALLDEQPVSPPLEEHNYTLTPSTSESDESFGVCLHISNHKVSLEYCAQCHENANSVWQGGNIF